MGMGSTRARFEAEIEILDDAISASRNRIAEDAIATKAIRASIEQKNRAPMEIAKPVMARSAAYERCAAILRNIDEALPRPID